MTTHAHDEAGGPDINVELGAAIHAAMFRRRVTQGQVAAALGIGQSTVSAKLRGRVGITVADLYGFGRVLGMDPADLLPRLDSNQQPSGYLSAQVSGQVADVVELAGWASRRAS